MFSESDCAKENLAALVYQMLRKNAAKYEASQVDNSASLRETIIAKTKEECAKLMPQATPKHWDDAYKYLGMRV